MTSSTTRNWAELRLDADSIDAVAAELLAMDDPTFVQAVRDLHTHDKREWPACNVAWLTFWGGHEPKHGPLCARLMAVRDQVIAWARQQIDQDTAKAGLASYGYFNLNTGRYLSTDLTSDPIDLSMPAVFDDTHCEPSVYPQPRAPKPTTTERFQQAATTLMARARAEGQAAFDSRPHWKTDHRIQLVELHLKAELGALLGDLNVHGEYVTRTRVTEAYLGGPLEYKFPEWFPETKETP